ncbi:TSUP family transporter [Robiginitomaculum antarcticum]|uniref:TSUP family transporter n=1 Tax=Robiginitomaculum antarcticum TaxID=437507 RepID=UPI000361AD55|nr:TSUP family transporter [Robiginitomaculum antarcticum]
MSAQIALIIAISALFTAFVSGVFGMAGGMIFMGIIAVYLGVAEAMVVHGLVQSLSNVSRAAMLKRHIRWDIMMFIALGALPAIAIMAMIAFIPGKALLYLMLGLLPFLLWLPKDRLAFDAAKPVHAMACGFLVMMLNLTAGVAGPALDFFFIKTTMNRNQIVATKAVTMFGSHIVKIFYFGIPLVKASGLGGLPPWWMFALAVPLTLLGTYLGTRVLQRLSDLHFKSYTKYIVTVIGVIYLWRAAVLYGLI